MCGLAGIVNKVPRAFDYSAFCVLGIANDSRGGDSCGVFIDGKYEYGVDKEKYFQAYFPESELLFNTKTARIALLHCRKASVGRITKETAQPVILTNDKGEVEFVVLHNGTIYNYKELAAKYIPEIDISGMTDSQVMARIFYYSGYDVLSEYNGGSVFVIIDYRNYGPHIYLFKGSSKKHAYSKEEEEERPLCYCIDSVKRELMFSSIGIHLLALRKDLNAWDLAANVLWEFNGKELVKVKDCPRDKVTQSREIEILYPTHRDFRSYKSIFELEDSMYNSWITQDLNQNICLFKGKRANGKIMLSKWGRVETSSSRKMSPTKPFWFFDGVMLKNDKCFRFLYAFRRKSGLNDIEFRKKYQTLIRYLSIDEVFRGEDGLMYRALSPTKAIVFTGSLQPLSISSKTEYLAGRVIKNTFNVGARDLDEYIPKEVKINFKSVEKEC